MLSGFVEARTQDGPADALLAGQGELFPRWHELGALDREGLTAGAELTLALGPTLVLGGGIDADPVESELLAVRGFGQYRHPCRCFAVAAFGSAREGRGGFDAGLRLDLMP
jgi:hypothetical protein